MSVTVFNSPRGALWCAAVWALVHQADAHVASRWPYPAHRWLTHDYAAPSSTRAAPEDKHQHQNKDLKKGFLLKWLLIIQIIIPNAYWSPTGKMQLFKKIKDALVVVCPCNVVSVPTNLVLLLPILKQFHKSVSFLHQVWVHAFKFGKRQDGLQSAFRLTGCPQTSASGRETVVDQPLFILDHFFKDGCLTFDAVKEFYWLITAWLCNLINDGSKNTALLTCEKTAWTRNLWKVHPLCKKHS